MSATTTRTATKAVATSPRRKRLLTVGAAVAAAVIIFSVAELAGMHLRQPTTGSGTATALNVGFVIAVSAIASFAGWALLALLEHFVTKRARAIWTTVAVIFLLLSLGGPFSGHGVSTGNRLLLGLIHVVVGAILITGLPRAKNSAR